MRSSRQAAQSDSCPIDVWKPKFNGLLRDQDKLQLNEAIPKRIPGEQLKGFAEDEEQTEVDRMERLSV
jgi:hypothetical protein